MAMLNNQTVIALLIDKQPNQCHIVISPNMKYTLGVPWSSMVHISRTFFVDLQRLTPRYELEHDIREEPTTEPTVLTVGITEGTDRTWQNPSTSDHIVSQSHSHIESPEHVQTEPHRMGIIGYYIIYSSKIQYKKPHEVPDTPGTQKETCSAFCRRFAMCWASPSPESQRSKALCWQRWSSCASAPGGRTIRRGSLMPNRRMRKLRLKHVKTLIITHILLVDGVHGVIVETWCTWWPSQRWTSTTVQWTVVVYPSLCSIFCSDWLCRLRFPCLAPSGVRLRTGLVVVGFRRPPVQPQVPAQRHEHPSLLKVQAEVAAYMERYTMMGHVFVSPSSRLYGGSNVMPNLSKFDVFDSTNSGFSIYVNSLEGDRILEWQQAGHWSHYSPGMGQTCHPKSAFCGSVWSFGAPMAEPKISGEQHIPNSWSINIIVWLWNYLKFNITKLSPFIA